MSTRQMAQRYSSGSGGHAGGGAGMGGLISQLMAPSMQQKGFQHESDMQKQLNDFQDQLAAKEREHELAMEKLKDSFKSNDLNRSLATKYNIPENELNTIIDGLREKAKAQVQNESAAEASPEVAAMIKRNRLATMAQPEVANAKMLEMMVPEGGTGIQPQVPGITGNPTQLFGANKQATTVPTKSIPQMDKKGNITGMIPYENAVAQTTTSGKVVQPQPDVSPSELNSRLPAMPPNMGFNVNDPSNSGFAMSQLMNQQPSSNPGQVAPPAPPQRMSPIPNNQSSLPPQGGDIIQELMKFLASPRASGNPPPFMNQGF